MRLNQYLQEKYVDAFKYFGHTFTVWSNPTKKEFAELKEESPMGFRFFVDFDKKVIYTFTSEVIHMTVAEENVIPQMNDTVYNSYLSGKDTNRWFTGHKEWNKPVQSDTWSSRGDFGVRLKTDKRKVQSLIDNCDYLLSKDMKWLDKYLPSKEIRYIIEHDVKEVFTEKFL